MEFENRLSHLRKKRKLSQSDFAGMVGIHANALGRYESGEARPLMDVTAKLSEALRVSLDYLVGNSDLKFDKETINRIVDIQSLSDEEQQPILIMADAYLRDVKTRKAYAG